MPRFAGLFNSDHMQYRLEQARLSQASEPSLADMTEKAIRILRRGESGYFLLVEGKDAFTLRTGQPLRC